MKRLKFCPVDEDPDPRPKGNNDPEEDEE